MDLRGFYLSKVTGRQAPPAADEIKALLLFAPHSTLMASRRLRLIIFWDLGRLHLIIEIKKLMF